MLKINGETIDKTMDKALFYSFLFVTFSTIMFFICVSSTVALIMPDKLNFVSYILGLVFDVAFVKTYSKLDIFLFYVLYLVVKSILLHARMFLIQMCKWKLEFELMKVDHKKIIERLDAQKDMNERLIRIAKQEDKIIRFFRHVKTDDRKKNDLIKTKRSH